MNYKYKIEKVDNISTGKKYCIVLDDRQHSCVQCKQSLEQTWR